MGISKSAALKNRNAIVAVAAGLFREKGVAAVGVAELMREAGFTQGGFYNHFESKEALVHEVVHEAMKAGYLELKANLDAGPAEASNGLASQIKGYLSTDHRDDIENGCPVSGLAHDVRRMAVATQATFTEGLKTAIDEISRRLPGDTGGRQKATALYSQLVGALILSRATASDDEQFSTMILEASKTAALASLKPGDG